MDISTNKFLIDCAKKALREDGFDFRQYCLDNLEAICEDGELKKILCTDYVMVSRMLSYPSIKIPKPVLNAAFEEWCRYCKFETGYEKNLKIAQSFINRGAKFSEECKKALVEGKKYELLLSLATKEDINDCIRMVGQSLDVDKGRGIGFPARRVKGVVDLGGDIQACFGSMRPSDVMLAAEDFAELGVTIDWTQYDLDHIGDLYDNASKDHLISLCKAGADIFRILQETTNKQYSYCRDGYFNNVGHRCYELMCRNDCGVDVWKSLLAKRENVGFLVNFYDVSGIERFVFLLFENLRRLDKTTVYAYAVLQAYAQKGFEDFMDSYKKLKNSGVQYGFYSEDKFIRIFSTMICNRWGFAKRRL